MKTILIAGGSGLVGRRLTRLLLDQGNEVRWLSRSIKRNRPVPVFEWNVETQYIDKAAFQGVDIVINLAGAGIADKKWSRSRKKLLIESRTQSVATLDKGIAEFRPDLELFINASAVGFYGDQGDRLCDEDSGPGSGFLSKCCLAWEEAVHNMMGNYPKAIVRIGIVLSTNGGALEKMLIPLKLHTNTYFGNGQQWMSWIHIDDLCLMIIHLLDSNKLENSEVAVFNAVGSNPARNKDFVQDVAHGMEVRAILLPAPAFGLRIAMGEMADVVLESTRVSSQKIKDFGYAFQFDDLQMAIRDLQARNL